MDNTMFVCLFCGVASLKMAALTCNTIIMTVTMAEIMMMMIIVMITIKKTLHLVLKIMMFSIPRHR